MLKNLLSDLFGHKPSTLAISETSSLLELFAAFPHALDFIERKYGIKIDAEAKGNTLREFCQKFSLPPAGILFAEIQKGTRTKLIREISAKEAAEWIRANPQVRILDVREEWELQKGVIQNSQPLTPVLLDEILNGWAKTTPLLFYCHFGIRSLDAATFLSDRGFITVSVIRGGIDAWAKHIDPTLTPYEEAWC